MTVIRPFAQTDTKFWTSIGARMRRELQLLSFDIR